MPIPIGFLIAAQASGMVIDFLGQKEQIRMGKMAAKLEQAGIQANIEASRLAAEDQSVEAMKKLRQNLGTQAAVMAARGTSSAAGSALVMRNEAVGTFNADERMRKINQMGNEAQLRAGLVISKLHQQTSENQTWNQFRQNVMNKIPTSNAAWNEIARGFSPKQGYGFGLTKIGG